MSTKTNRFPLAFRLSRITETEQHKIRKKLNNSLPTKVVIQLTKRYDVLQRRKEKLNWIKLKL